MEFRILTEQRDERIYELFDGRKLVKDLTDGKDVLIQKGETLTLPEVEMAAEDYRRLARLAKMGEVKLELDSRVHFDDRDLNGYNVIADIPGSDAN